MSSSTESARSGPPSEYYTPETEYMDDPNNEGLKCAGPEPDGYELGNFAPETPHPRSSGPFTQLYSDG